ncbi:glycoside hydrolase family protein [Spirosoma areae]
MKPWLPIVCALFFALTSGYGQTVIPHPVPEEFAADYYAVTVNGQSVPVFHAGLNIYFASFDFTGDATVSVTSKADTDSYSGQTSNKEAVKIDEKGYWRGEVSIRPLVKNIKPQLTGKTVTFTLTEAGQYSVERAGTVTAPADRFKDDAIFLFANRPDPKQPDLTASGVIHLKAGIHQRHIDLKSGQTLYLDAGAVLFGSINVWDAKNVSILGRGTVVYYGPQSETHDDGWKHQKNWHPLTTHNVQGLTMRGITFVGRSRTWSLQTHTTFDAVFDNIKIIAVNPQNINGDGIDWYGGGRTKVVNSFIRSMDDCFAFFTEGSSQDMWATTKNSVGEVKDISIENCVLWTTLANVFRIGFNGQALTTSNISMKNTDIIHISKSEWYAPWSLFCMVSPNSKGKARHSRYLFEGIRFEEPAALFGLQNPESQFENVVLKDITMTGEPVPSLIKNTTRDVTFDKVILNGKPVASEADIPLRAGSVNLGKATYLPAK